MDCGGERVINLTHPVVGEGPSALEGCNVFNVLFGYICGHIYYYGLVDGIKRLLDHSMLTVDERSAYPLADNAYTLFWICLSYFILCLLTPLYTACTKPVSQRVTRPLEVAINGAALLMYIFITYEFTVNIFAARINVMCSYSPPSDRPFTRAEQRLVFAMYIYYLSKILRMLDSVVFIMRHKTKCLTLVHVLHHGLMPAAAWVTMRYWPASSVLFYQWLHSAVHILLYTYFFITSLGPQFKRYVGWKRQLTQLQLLHFVAMLVHECINHARGCRYWQNFVYGTMYLSFGVMIAKYVFFYYIAYIIPDREKRKLQLSSQSSSSKNGHIQHKNSDQMTISSATTNGSTVRQRTVVVQHQHTNGIVTGRAQQQNGITTSTKSGKKGDVVPTSNAA